MIPLTCDTEGQASPRRRSVRVAGVTGHWGRGEGVILLWAELPLGMMTNAADGCTTQ